MNPGQFGEGACGETRKCLDSYISNALTLETHQEIQRHIESCPACAAELGARTQLWARLKGAVNAQCVPPELQVRIREQIRNRQPGGWFAVGWGRWAVAAAASLLVCAVKL